MLFALLLAALFTGSHGGVISARTNLIVHERRDHEPAGKAWIKGPRMDHDFVVRARVGMVQQNLDRGHDLLMQISDPESTRYGEHYSAAEVDELFAPHESTIESVKSWLESHVDNVTLSTNKQFFAFTAEISKLERLLQTKFHEYGHHAVDRVSLGCDHYSVPDHLKEHIDFITPGLTMVERLEPSKSKMLKGRSLSGPRINPNPVPENHISLDATASCGGFTTPACIKKLYGIDDEVMHKAGDGNSIGVYENLLDYLNYTDFNGFLQNYEPSFPKGIYPTEYLIDGAPDPKVEGAKVKGVPYGLESDLDFSVIYPLVYPIPVSLFQVDDYHWEKQYRLGLFNTFLDYLDASYCTKAAFGEKGDSPIYDAVYPDPAKNSKNPWEHPHQCGVVAPPPVISLSYSPDERDLSVGYQKRQCQEFMKLSMRGVTIFAASGDSGVAPSLGKCLGSEHKIFGPSGLTNCPYVTSVGATMLPRGSEAGKDPERAPTDFGSGGGFSNLYPTPSWQKQAVANYLEKHKPPYLSYETVNNPQALNVTGRFNRNGRGTPDVAASGDNLVVKKGRYFFALNGTSGSAPLWAGIIARINGARRAIGKKPVGFINPTLYAHPEVFNDIVTGDNPGCGTKGFSCAAGWDPVTGLGTPMYDKLKALLLSLP